MTKKTLSPEQQQLMLTLQRLVKNGATSGQIVAAASAVAESLERSGVTDDLTQLGPLPSEPEGIMEWLKGALKIRGVNEEWITEMDDRIRAMEEEIGLPVDESLSFDERVARIDAAVGNKKS
jgi:hypothetical protein